jgi:putative peptidoglycan lipid II flippase
VTSELATPAPIPSGSGIGRASAILASGTIVSRVLGFISAAVLANTLGTLNAAANTFTIANQLPNNIYAIIAGGLLSAILGVVVFLVIAIIATLLAGPLVHLYAQQQTGGSSRGLSSRDFQLATAFAYWCLPQVFFYALYSLLGEVLNARKVFGPFTWAPVANNLIAIAGLLAFNVLYSSVQHENSDLWTPSMVALIGGSACSGAEPGCAIDRSFAGAVWGSAGSERLRSGRS